MQMSQKAGGRNRSAGWGGLVGREEAGALGVAALPLHLCLREEKQGGIVRSLFPVKSLNEDLQFFKDDFYIFTLFLAALGLGCFVRAFSSCSKWGLLFISVLGLLVAVASLVAECGPQGAWASVVVARRVSGGGAWAYWLFNSVRDLPRPGIKPVSPALARRFLSTGPPGKS